MYSRYDIACCFFLSSLLLATALADWQDLLNLQRAAARWQKRRYTPREPEYPEFTDNDDLEAAAQEPQWNQIPPVQPRDYAPRTSNYKRPQFPDTLDKNISWDANWKPNVRFGQISAVSIDPNGNIVIFHRGARIWGTDTFDNENKFNPDEGPVRENTVVLLDKTGRKLAEWGRDMFYLPHGLTVDSMGNYWLTDVALHQVFKFDAKDVTKHIEELKKEQSYNLRSSRQNANTVYGTSPLKPSLILGEAFMPGNNEKRFCKPTAVAVHPTGDFFVSDGYCNSRVLKFNSKGELILQWGRHWGSGNAFPKPPPNAFVVPHALTLAEELDIIFVADREDGRVMAYFASNGTFYKEYSHPSIGTKIYSVAYAQKKLYLINGREVFPNPFGHVRGFVLDVFSGNLLSQFGPPKDMDRPHDLAVTKTGSEIYVVELDIHLVYRFVQAVNATLERGSSNMQSEPQHDSTLPVDKSPSDAATGGTATATLVLSLVTAAVTFIALCVLIAAVVARCQKRGCLLGMPSNMRWDAERRDNFKLSSLLEARRGKHFKLLERRPNPRDFSKLNTEPDTSEDEHPENSLTKII